MRRVANSRPTVGIFERRSDEVNRVGGKKRFAIWHFQWVDKGSRTKGAEKEKKEEENSCGEGARRKERERKEKEKIERSDKVALRV